MINFHSESASVTDAVYNHRSSILTGKYTHNHHTYENSVAKGCNAPSWRVLNENKTIGVYMSMAGYKTGFFGKETPFLLLMFTAWIWG